MKKLSLISFVVICLFVFTLTVQATGLRTEFNSYEIEKLDDLYLGKKVEQVWTLSYSSDESPVTVVKRNTAEGTKYVVHSKFFEVSYASTVSGFGAQEVRKAWSGVPRKINKAVINKEELKRQEIISPKKVNDERALELIASYLPELLNDAYTHLLN
jgi:hypothetical protein